MLGRPLLDEFHPVLRPADPDWRLASGVATTDDLLALDDERLARIDPVAMNLIVARDMPEVDRLDIPRYQQTVNAWAADFVNRCLPEWEQTYHQAPEAYDHHLTMFRLGMITQYLDVCRRLGYDPAMNVSSIPGDPSVGRIRYTNTEQLFLHGLIDRGVGACTNLVALHVAIGWRLGWPVSIASVQSHLVMRYDDGQAVYNLDAAATGRGGWAANDDEYFLKLYRLPLKAVACGSDLRAMRPREMLGLFIGLRARIYENTHRFAEAECDYLLARALFPQNRQLYYGQMQVSLQDGAKYFEPGERCHPNETAAWLTELCRIKGWPIPCLEARRQAAGPVPLVQPSPAEPPPPREDRPRQEDADKPPPEPGFTQIIASL